MIQNNVFEELQVFEHSIENAKGCQSSGRQERLTFVH